MKIIVNDKQLNIDKSMSEEDIMLEFKKLKREFRVNKREINGVEYNSNMYVSTGIFYLNMEDFSIDINSEVIDFYDIKIKIIYDDNTEIDVNNQLELLAMLGVKNCKLRINKNTVYYKVVECNTNRLKTSITSLGYKLVYNSKHRIITADNIKDERIDRFVNLVLENKDTYGDIDYSQSILMNDNMDNELQHFNIAINNGTNEIIFINYYGEKIVNDLRDIEIDGLRKCKMMEYSPDHKQWISVDAFINEGYSSCLINDIQCIDAVYYVVESLDIEAFPAGYYDTLPAANIIEVRQYLRNNKVYK